MNNIRSDDYCYCGCCCYVLVFLFKQKTAYEMRISDWSSDVCSSDLSTATSTTPVTSILRSRGDRPSMKLSVISGKSVRTCSSRSDAIHSASVGARPIFTLPPTCAWRNRSEEHTSELQSLMRISYAVFCLKKKKSAQRTQINHTTDD